MRALTTLNGRLPAGQLVTIDTTGHQLRADAAASLARMRVAGAPIGVVTSAYRDLAQQQREVERAAAGLTPSAAPVGRSWHGEGLAVDFPEPGRSWVRTHGLAHGWRFPLTSEPWHGEYHDDLDQHTHNTGDDMFSDADRALLQNIENLIARSSDGTDLRSQVGATRADLGTVANELRAHDARTTQGPAAGGAVALDAASLDAIAAVVADRLATRLQS